MSYRSGYGGDFNTGKRPPQKAGESRGGYSAAPPPSSLNNRPFPSSTTNQPGLTKHGYTSMEALSSDYGNTSQYGLGKRKGKTEDEYFDDDDDDNNGPDMAYIPAPGSPSYKKKQSESSDDEEDPLDAFMQGLEKHLEKEKTKPVNAVQDTKTIKGVRGDIDDEDDEESYYRYMEENPMAGVVDEGSDNEVEYDEDGNPIPAPKREIDPLPSIDHSEIDY